MLGLFESDPATEAIVMVGEIGGTAEEAAFYKLSNSLPVLETKSTRNIIVISTFDNF